MPRGSMFSINPILQRQSLMLLDIGYVNPLEFGRNVRAAQAVVKNGSRP